MQFKNKISLGSIGIVLFSLVIFGFSSYQHTKKHSMVQLESSLHTYTQTNGLANYVDLWLL